MVVLKKISIMVIVFCMFVFLGNTVAYSEEGDYGLIHWSFNKGVLTFEGEGVIESEGPWVKYCNKIKKIVFGPEITRMSDNMSNYRQLTSVVFYNIVPNSFSGCSKLQEVRFMGENPVYSGTDLDSCPLKKIIFDNPNVDYCEEDSFLYNRDKTIVYRYLGKKDKVVIPEGVEIIHPYAFFENKSIRSITFPLSLREIGMSAFHRCEKLQTIEIPSSVNAIGACAFEKCTNLKSVRFLGDHMVFETKINDSTGERIVGGATFALCKSLESIEIPSCDIIPDAMFLKCSKLKTVYISEGTGKLGSSVFSECKKLEKVFLPDNISVVGLTFDGIPSSTVFICPEGSEIEKKLKIYGYTCMHN